MYIILFNAKNISTVEMTNDTTFNVSQCFRCSKRCEKKNQVVLLIETTLQRIFHVLPRGVTLSNFSCNLSPDGATKLREKLQEKLPTVTATLEIYALPGLTSLRPSKMLLDKNLPGTRVLSGLGTLHITPRPLHTCNITILWDKISMRRRALRGAQLPPESGLNYLPNNQVPASMFRTEVCSLFGAWR